MKKLLIVLCAIVIVLLSLFLVTHERQTTDWKVGVMLPLTGDYASWGDRAKNGIQLALDEYNEDTKADKKISLIYEDSPGDPQKAVSAFQKLVELDKVKYILGPLSSAEVLAIAPIAVRKKVIVLTPVSSAPQITHSGDFIFRNCMSDIFEGNVAADFVINTLKKERIGILYLNNDYGIGLKDTFSKKIASLGKSIDVLDSFNAGDTDFRSQLTKINSINPDVIILAGYASEMIRILRQAKELGLSAQFVSFSPFESPEIIKLAGPAAEGVYYTYQGFDSQSEREVVNKFVTDYKLKYDEQPDIFAALSFDALKIYGLAFVMAKRDDVELVKNALYGIKAFQGVTGKTSFDENGDVVKPIGIKKVEHGDFIWVKAN